MPSVHQFRPNPKDHTLAYRAGDHAERSEVVPDLPRVADFVPGYEASAWYGLVAPKRAPPEVVETLNRAINAMLTDPAAKTRFVDLGASLLPGSAADFGNLIRNETEK